MVIECETFFIISGAEETSQWVGFELGICSKINLKELPALKEETKKVNSQVSRRLFDFFKKIENQSYIYIVIGYQIIGRYPDI